MDLPRFVALVRARLWLIGGIVVAAMLLAIVVSALQPSRYVATAHLLFGRTTDADTIIAGGSTDTGEVPERVVATNLALAELDTVADRVRQQLRSRETVDQIKSAVSVTVEGASDVASVSATSSTPNGAAKLANLFGFQIVNVRRQTALSDIQRAIDALNAAAQTPASSTPGATTTDSSRALRDRIAQLKALMAIETGGVRLVEPASPPAHRSSPKPLRNGVIAAFVALALALFVVVLLARFDEHIHDEEELTSLMQAPVLARIPRGPSRRPLTQLHVRDGDDAFLEAFEFLRLNLQLMDADGQSLVLAVTSPNPGDGKTTTVAWLARSLAMSGAEVVAVDLDLRRPELQSYFDVSDDSRPRALDALLRSNGAEGSGGAVASQAKRGYSREEISAGLVELVRYGGNARRAARALREAGHEIPESTLRRWKDAHASRYAEIRARGSDEFGEVTFDGAYRDKPVLSVLARDSTYPRLRLLTGGDHPALPPELIGRERLRQLFAELRSDAAYVLADTVPVSTVADASAVAAAADGVILVVDLERLRRKDLLAAKKQLGNARAKVLGIVLNRASTDSAAYPVAGEMRELEREPSGP